MRFQADGGGDTPESVNQALYEAVTKTNWSDNPTAYRVIFLVGVVCDILPHWMVLMMIFLLLANLQVSE